MSFLNKYCLGGFLITGLIAFFEIGMVIGDETVLKKKFLQEAPKAWKEYGAFLNTLQGTTTSKMVFTNKPSMEGRIEIRQNKKCKQVLSQEKGDKHTKGEIISCTPDYCFQLSRKTQEGKWALSLLNLNAPDSNQSGLELDAQMIIKSNTSGLVSLERTTLLNLISKPEFQVKAIKPIRFEDADCFEIQWDSTHLLQENGSQDFYPEQRGVMILDPARFWCLRKADFSCDYSNSKGVVQKIEVKFKDNGDHKFPIPGQRIISNITYTSTRVFDLVPATPLPPDLEFKLTAFGFPEPSPPIQPTRWFLWFSLVGVFLIIVGAVLFSRQKPNGLESSPTH